MSSNKLAKRIRYALRYVPDEQYIQLNYFAHFHKFANLKNPTTFNEKLNWLKLHNHNPLYTQIVDKYEAKVHIEKIIGGGTQSLRSAYGIILMRLNLTNFQKALC